MHTAISLPDWLSSPSPWLAGTGVFVLVLAATYLVRRGLTRALTRTLIKAESEQLLGRQIGRFAGLVVFVLGTIYALGVAGVQVGPLFGALGVGGVAVAFAAQDTLQNLVAGILIQMRRPFRVGDQITTLTYAGTVVDIDLRTVHLVTYDGLDVLLPAAEVLKAPITNITHTPLRRTTLPVGVAYDTDLELAQQVILDTITDVPGVQPDPAPAAWVEDFADSAITISVLYWHDTHVANMLQVRSDVAIALKKALDAQGIEIAFPQRVVWLRREDPQP